LEKLKEEQSKIPNKDQIKAEKAAEMMREIVNVNRHYLRVTLWY
jgi:hypothetical protein